MGMVQPFVRALLPVTFILSVASCSGVKQQQPPRIPEADATSDGMGASDATDDMDTGEEDTLDVVKDDAPKETKAQKRMKCCQQCVAGIEDDKSGDPPGAIPCTKLTSKMTARCVVWFDKHPTTGKEAQECVEEAAKPDDAEAGLGAKDGAKAE